LLHFIARPLFVSPGSFPDNISCELYHDLVAHDINEQLAYQLVEMARKKIAPQGKESKALMTGAVKCLLSEMISVSHPDQETASNDRPGARTIAAFIGPTGVGKTTTVAKLAARHALDKKRKVLLVTLDTYRIAAVEQLKVYAGIIGVPIEIATTIGELDRILRENFKKDLILIDTIGCSQKDIARMSELAEYLHTATEIEKHLVLSATTKSIDLQEIIDRFSLFGLTNLVFTKLDETATFGPILNELVRTRKPLSYFTNGQRVPEDLRVPTPQDVADLVISAN
jgi:flagellar biosynthesis protein FlhF